MKSVSSFFILSWLVTIVKAQNLTSGYEHVHTGTSLRGRDKQRNSESRKLWTCATLPTDRYFHLVAKHTEMVVTVKDRSKDNGATIIQFPAAVDKNYNWRVKSTDSGYYHILAEHCQKGLNVLAGGKNNGDAVVQWEVDQGVSDDWCFVDRGSGYYSIVNRGSGKALAVKDRSINMGSTIIQWDVNANIPSQVWKLEPVCAKVPTDRSFNIVSKHSRMVLNVLGGSTSDGASLVQSPVQLVKYDNWRLQDAGMGFYQIIAEHSQKGINALQYGKSNGDPVIQWTSASSSEGREDDWCFIDQGLGYYAIVNRDNYKAITVPDQSKAAAGAKLIQWDYLNVPNQMWNLAEVTLADSCLTRYGSVPTSETCDSYGTVGSILQLDNRPTDILNTAVDTETQAMLKARLAGDVPIQDPANMDSLYNPVFDAYCFNEDYPVPSLSSAQQYGLYMDYKIEFDKINAFTADVSLNNNRITNNRIPGMFLRMCFHDNSVSVLEPDFQDYVAKSIDPITKKWIGEAIYMRTSGADASNLICPQERYHPNQNYDQTATRVLNSIQRTLKGKYKYMSYADLLHNGCNAATIFLTGQDAITSLKNNPFTFGRKDACYVDKKCTVKKYPLCGPTELLPGVSLSVKYVTDWFRLRGMSECLFMGLMWTHTTVDNMGSSCPIKKLSCTATTTDVSAFTDKSKLYFQSGDYLDYFSFFLERGTMTTLPETGNDSSPNCNWWVDGKQVPWPMTGIDCTVGLDNVQKAGETALAKAITNLAHNPSYNKVDILQCALKVLGGTGGVEGGACNLVLPTECKSPMNGHKFGGYYSTLPSSSSSTYTYQRTVVDPKCEAVGY